MEHKDPHQRQALWSPRSKSQSRDASDRCWPISREWNVLEKPELDLMGRLSCSRAIMHTSFKAKGRRSRSPSRLMLRPKVRNIFRTGRPTNIKLGSQTEQEDQHQLQAPWPPRSKVKVARSRDACDRFWPISRERNVLETPKLVGRTLSTPRAILRTSFKVKDKVQGHQAVRHIFRTERPTNFKLGVQMEDGDPYRRRWTITSMVKG